MQVTCSLTASWFNPNRSQNYPNLVYQPFVSAIQTPLFINRLYLSPVRAKQKSKFQNKKKTKTKSKQSQKKRKTDRKSKQSQKRNNIFLLFHISKKNQNKMSQLGE